MSRPKEYANVDDLFSPFIQPFTPMDSPMVQFIPNDFSKLESPLIQGIHDILSPPPSFQMLPMSQNASNPIGPMEVLRGLPLAPSQVLDHKYQQFQNTERSEKPVKSHKEAEQKRRDLLKNSFKVCKAVLPPIKGNPSKVQILKKATKYIKELVHQKQEDNEYITILQSELKKLGAKVPLQERSRLQFDSSDEE